MDSVYKRRYPLELWLQFWKRNAAKTSPRPARWLWYIERYRQGVLFEGRSPATGTTVSTIRVTRVTCGRLRPTQTTRTTPSARTSIRATSTRAMTTTIATTGSGFADSYSVAGDCSAQDAASDCLLRSKAASRLLLMVMPAP